MLALSHAPVLQLRSVTKYYHSGLPSALPDMPAAAIAEGRARARARALDGVHLVVHAGELVAVQGPAGSGKTTLLLCAAGLLAPDGGVVSVRGVPLTDRGPPGACLVSSGAYRDGELVARCMRMIDRCWLVLIDEPPFQGEHVRNWLMTILARRAGDEAGVLLASREPLYEHADRVVRLRQGRLVDGIERVEYARPSATARVGDRVRRGTV